MIRFSLACDGGHAFESWFPGGAAYDEQVRRGLVECPVCRSTAVRKAIMAPALSKSTRGPSAPREAQAGAGEGAAAPDIPAVMDERLAALRVMMREMRAAISKHTTDVGASFPEEARKIHFGEADPRPIRGEANPEEARALIEEGVPILPIPVLPDDRN